MKSAKNIIIGSLLIALVVMSIGYSNFASKLTINGTTEITGEWNVKITNVTVESVSDQCDAGSPQFTDTSVTFNAKLHKPGDSITYLVTIENLGTIDAVLNNINFYEDGINGTDAINYTTSEVAYELAAGEKTTLTINTEYLPDTVEPPEITTKTITGTIEYVQK